MMRMSGIDRFEQTDQCICILVIRVRICTEFATFFSGKNSTRIAPSVRVASMCGLEFQRCRIRFAFVKYPKPVFVINHASEF